MLLVIIRALFVLLAAGVGAFFAEATGSIVAFLLPVALIIVVVAVDLSFPAKDISRIAAVFSGLLVGLILASLLQLALGPVLSLVAPENQLVKLIVYLNAVVLLCYLCISLLLQTKDDFRFISQ